MVRYLFISQETLTAWVEQDKVSLDNNRITIKADGRTLDLVEAVRFVKVESGEDQGKLIGKVKTAEQLRQLGMERCGESVIFGDVVYAIQEGYMGEVKVETPPPATAPILLTTKKAPAARNQSLSDRRTQPNLPAVKPEEQAAPEAGEKKEPTDEELLTQFLLKHL
jgi:hypothetical protein